MIIKNIFSKNYMFLLILLIIKSLLIYAQDDISIEELIDLKNQNLITNEEFNILKSEILKENIEEENLYDLLIDSKLISRTYKIYEKNGKYFFPIKEFLRHINFKNYRETKNELILFLGSSLREVKINLREEYVFQENDEIYIESDRFSEFFLRTYSIEPNEYLIRMYLSFDTPDEVMQLLDISKNKILKKSEKNELIFNSKRKAFDLGYTRIQLGKNFDKELGKNGYQNSWDGNLGYQGGLLYGQITSEYNLKDKELNTVRLEYTGLWNGHNFDIENRRNGDNREWGLSFYKDRGFYETAGGQIVIRENVPLGSRAELIYMGTSIEIKDEENGIVEFENPLIRSDRTYTLKIYEPNGKIYTKEIRTTQDYNLQQKRQFEYRLGVNENSYYDKFETELNVFYGITNSLTLGVGYSRNIEDIKTGRDITGNINQETKYIDKLKLDLIYGGTYNSVSYIFSLSGDQAINQFESYEEIGNNRRYISSNERYTYKYLNQFNYLKWRFIYEHEKFGIFYDEIKKDRIDLKYDIFKNTNIGYVYEFKEYRKSKDEIEYITFDSDYIWNKFLFTIGTSLDLNNREDNEYRVGAYYSGWQKLTGRIENTWRKNGDEYETRVSLYNNNFGGFLDFTTELAYSKQEKEKISFKFAVKLDNWLRIDTNLKNDGTRNHRVGIDRIFDLKNPTVDIDNMNSSRVKVITFIDSNNNDIYDAGDKIVPGVEVNIGDKKVLTNEKGEGMFYGIGNGILYDMKVTIKKPSFTLGNNNIKVRSNFSSTIDAYIPIKPMLTLSGNIEIDKELKLTESEKIEFYNDLIIELKDFKGGVIETTAPDNEGLFDISGLFPEEYYIEVTYVGTKLKLKNIKEEIQLHYSEDSSVNFIILKINNNKISINSSELQNKFSDSRRKDL